MGKSQKKSEQETANQVAELGEAVGHGAAEAIAEYVERRLDARLGELRDDLTGLIERQHNNVQGAKESGDTAAKKSTNEATVAVKEADKAVKEAEANPTDESTKAAEVKVVEAEEKVAEATKKLEQRVTAVEEILMPWRKDETPDSRKPSRFDGIEKEMGKMSSQIDQAEAAYNEAAAKVRTNSEPGLGLVALVTFVGAFVVLTVIALFTSFLSVFWGAVLLAVATTAFVVIVTAGLDWASSRQQARVKKRSRAKAGYSMDDVLPVRMSESEAKEAKEAARH